MNRFSLVLVFTLTITLSQTVYADESNNQSVQEENLGVFIPDNEYVAYFDSNGVYTVVGVIKNTKELSVVPTVTVNIQEKNKILSETFEYVPILPAKDLPFKLKFPEIKTESPVLLKPEVSFVLTEKKPLYVEVIYDKTLVKHEDGHLTGRIINNGNSSAYNIKVFALINGKDGVLDLGQNFEMIDKMEPGEIKNFTMYPDPAINEEIVYYSCFVPTDTSVVPMIVTRNGEKFYFRYDSGTWYYDAKFNEDGTELSIKTQTSFNIDTYASFEFPVESDDQKLQVYLNDEPKEFIQSRDDLGNFHVSFNVAPLETGELVITGFKQGWTPDEDSRVPKWLKNSAKLWSEEKITKDEFVSQIKYMINFGLIDIQSREFKSAWDVPVPDWIKNVAGWWGNEKISDQEFSKSIQYLIENKIIDLY